MCLPSGPTQSTVGVDKTFGCVYTLLFDVLVGVVVLSEAGELLGTGIVEDSLRDCVLVPLLDKIEYPIKANTIQNRKP
jgi:hypothetical protein